MPQTKYYVWKIQTHGYQWFSLLIKDYLPYPVKDVNIANASNNFNSFNKTIHKEIKNVEINMPVFFEHNVQNTILKFYFSS